MRDVGVIVRSHHERWDGAGYPDGLAGEGIPLEARIITCCDSWNAMRTDRSYRRALSPEVALAELERQLGRPVRPLHRRRDHGTTWAAGRGIQADAGGPPGPTRAQPRRGLNRPPAGTGGRVSRRPRDARLPAVAAPQCLYPGRSG